MEQQETPEPGVSRRPGVLERTSASTMEQQEQTKATATRPATTSEHTSNSTTMEESNLADAGSEKREKPLLITSSLLGLPPYVLDPEDLPASFNPFPGKEGSQFRQIEEDMLVKYGTHVSLAEAEAMEYVRRHTSVECPTVHGAYVLDGCGYIIMSFEHGKLLPEFWQKASEQEKEAVIAKLQQYFSELRSLKSDYVGGFNRSPSVMGEFEWDFHKTDHKYGPYPDEHGFNEGIVDALSRSSPSPENTDPESPGYNNMYALRQLVHSLRNHEIVFTHGDLNAGNILIRDDLTVVILDWYTAGFYPAYWEWYKATWHGVFTPSFIRQLERFVPPYWIEAEIMNQIYSKILG
ncbi:Uu.00g007250.m01.CDS01 [Anthostomella pinea]|uniref:Uu.00g007250.m01.CDS01 n=1 Tax=Anthostomella pinea TaxID=933095 RepID=A0AAI8YPW3_9PEZI|nr:Uu.00g007250.m01.CDS01 [Anthostomella pinea]